jgi:spore germination protein YaaH
MDMRRVLLIAFIFLFALLFLMPKGAFASSRTLYLGLSGSDVAALQRALIAKGYLAAGKDTGTFGPLTDAALKKFQCEQKIICESSSAPGYGVYGSRTQAALASASSASGSAPASSAKGAFEISGWIPYWRTATGTADTIPHLSQLTSVMPFGYTMNSDGTLRDTAKLTEEPWVSFIAEARKNKVRVIPSVMWGNGDAIHAVLSDTTMRIALEDEIAKVVKDNNFDGIDIDFEAKKHETIDYFSTFLKGLYQRMGNKWVYCTIEARMPLSHRFSPGAKIPPDAMDYANDYAALNKYCDRVEMMAYDQGTIDVLLNNARTAPYAPVADPGWVESMVNLAAESISKNKIVIGIPTYGYEYTVTPLSGSGFQYKVLWPFNPRYATDIAKKLNITPVRTSANELGFVYDAKLLEPAPTGTDSTQTQQSTIPSTSVAQNAGSQVNTNQPFNYMTWSDAFAIKDKVDLARRLGVRGVAVFKFDGGQDPLMWEMLK